LRITVLCSAAARGRPALRSFSEKGGHIIISIYRFLDQERIWDGMDQGFKIYAADTVQNLRGTWDIRVFQGESEDKTGNNFVKSDFIL